MKLNIANEIDQEIYTLIDKLCGDEDFVREDEMAVVAKTPFIVNPGAIPGWINKTYLIMYPKLLSYTEDRQEQTVPWICCRIELEGDRTIEMERKILNFFVTKLSEVGYTPLMDEDSYAKHWKRTLKKGWTKFECYVNPDYPNGWWENHTL